MWMACDEGFVRIIRHGRLLLGPLLADDDWRYNGLPPHVSGVGAPFKVEGLADSVTETRVLQAPQRVSALAFGVTVATPSVGPLDDPLVGQLTMQRVWHRVVDRQKPGIRLRVRDTRSLLLTALAWQLDKNSCLTCETLLHAQRASLALPTHPGVDSRHVLSWPSCTRCKKPATAANFPATLTPTEDAS
jgi:hypothetical protein